MSWLFSRALAEEYSARECSDGEPSAPSKSTNTPAMYLSHGKTTEASKLSRFGTTCERLTDDRGAELLISYLEDFRARISVSQTPTRAESTVKEADSGRKWRESSVRYDRATSGWRTHRCLFDEALPGSSVILPRWGMTVDGVLLERTTPALLTKESGCGCWPTPTVHGNTNAPKTGTKRGTGLATAVKRYPTPRASDKNGGRIVPLGTKNGEGLNDVIERHCMDAMASWPTPTATAHKGWSQNHNRAASDDRIDYTVEREACKSGTPGRLNPDWVEWLMGCPVGWTRLGETSPVRYNWTCDPADSGDVTRVTTNSKHRAHRIRCIGNGQVPDAMALAFQTLEKDIK